MGAITSRDCFNLSQMIGCYVTCRFELFAKNTSVQLEGPNKTENIGSHIAMYQAATGIWYIA